MILFWIIAIGLTAIALGFIVPPLLKKNLTVVESNHNALNIALYQEKLEELTVENLPTTQQAQAQTELERTLLQELNDETPTNSNFHGRWIGIFVAVLLPTLTVSLYLYLGNPQFLEPTRIPGAESVERMPHEFSGMVEKLAAKLKENPDNLSGWQMLARSYVALERYPEAIQAYDKALSLGGDKDPDILANYVETLGTLHQGQLPPQAATLLEQALALNSNHQKSLWLSGYFARQQGDYALALQQWQRLSSLLSSEETEVKQLLEEEIVKIQKLKQQSENVTEE